MDQRARSGLGNEGGTRQVGPSREGAPLACGPHSMHTGTDR
jgi:hypothetical protein